MMKQLLTLCLLVTAFSLHSQSITLVKDINPGTSSAQINDIIRFGSSMLMMGDDGTDGAELWISNGTSGGTYQVKDIYAGASPSYPANFVEMGGYVYFRADHPTYGFEIWRTDGTFSGTTLVKDVNPGTDDGVYTTTTFDIVESNGLLFMTLDDGVYGRELHVSDGTSAGTTRLLDTYVGSIGTVNAAGDPQEITPFGTGVLFSTYDYDLGLGTGLGRELWFSDGTIAGTYMIKDIHSAAGSSNPDNIFIVGSKALFAADDGTNGKELWITDGTPGGTMMLKDINPGGSSDPESFCKVGTSVFFFADDGTNGKELWKTDGTPAGTGMVKDIHPTGDSFTGAFGSWVKMVELNGILYFAADDGSTGTNGGELWRSDGTPGGTYLFMDINPGTSSSYLNYFTVINNVLYYYANDGTNGYELWGSNGSASGTKMIEDLNPGADSGSPSKMFNIGSMMYFTANNGSTGSELFSLDLSTVSLPVELLDFQADQLQNGQVRLSWATATETNNDRFIVERRDGEEFKELHSVAGKGTTTAPSFYEAIDADPRPGLNQYRLRQIDLDGSTSYSSIVEITVDRVPQLTIFQHPDRQSITVSVSGERTYPVDMKLVNTHGQTVSTFQLPTASNSFTFSVHEIPTGTYWLMSNRYPATTVVVNP